MRANTAWLDDPEVFQVNRLQAHSDHLYYESREACSRKESSLVQLLNGTWEFWYSPDPMSRPKEFYRPDYDRSGFDRIAVPGHIELAGYGQIQYINTLYPWEGHVYRRPAYSLGDVTGKEGSFSQGEDNPVGSYVKVFDLEAGLRGKRVVISFEGVEQAMYLWLNGHFVGYSEDSFTPSEFDLTPYIQDEGNMLAVEVYKRSTAAFLEDQDFFRFFGIFRDVKLCARPKLHLEDLWAKPWLDEDLKTGRLGFSLTFSSVVPGGNAKLVLTGPDGKICYHKEVPIEEQVELAPEEIGAVQPWEHSDPCLYDLEVTLMDPQGAVVEVVPYAIGFRRLEIKDRVIYLNGKRLVLNGVNRHEWSASRGRSITREDMEWDMACIQRNHINAVRTCHYPNQIPWYSLCDQEGIYLMAETNLESHGSWQKLGSVEPSWNVPGSLPQWQNAVLDRARTNFELFKNHVSVLFWSLGNESYTGETLAAMDRFYKEKDPLRLTHYEGVFQDRTYEDRISDVESRMYAPPSQVVQYLENQPKKPFILCEYMHGMGNSLGGLKSYMDLLDRYERYQGGFLWDFIDQAVAIEDVCTGNTVLRYGGDFGDRPSDYEFSGNGLVFADRTEKPAMQEVRYYYGIYR
ncbi:MAG: glycoside hydrolase family 2 TIM barrel-domain containing protein [Blautia sp.]|jgi:beta-galactosidase